MFRDGVPRSLLEGQRLQLFAWSRRFRGRSSWSEGQHEEIMDVKLSITACSDASPSLKIISAMILTDYNTFFIYSYIQLTLYLHQ